MNWTDEERLYFFGDLGSRQETGGDPEKKMESDRRFLEQYCSANTRDRLASEDVSALAARRTFGRLAEIVPSGDHTSPSWSGPNQQPTIVIGSPILVNKPGEKTRTKSPRFGVVAQQARLFLFADIADIETFARFGTRNSPRFPWKQWGDKLYVYQRPIDSQPGDLEDPMSGAPLLDFLLHLQTRLEPKQVKSGHLRLVRSLVQCREEMELPPDWTAVFPRLSGELGEEASETSRARQPRRSAEKVSRRNDALAEVSPLVDVSSTYGCNSMLAVLREVALQRVRTAHPNFNQAALDGWIVGQGYHGLHNSHLDTQHLYGVYASSLVNAGGAKPSASAFGLMIRDAVSPFVPPHGTPHARFTVRQLAINCLNSHHSTYLGGGFLGDIQQLSTGGSARRLITGLFTSIYEFQDWLGAHGVTARGLHQQLGHTAPGDFERVALDYVRSVDGLPWMGVATAANFMKDSQLPGLNGNLNHGVGSLFGWFAKPDLHVARLMAYITGRAPQGVNPARFRVGAAISMFAGNAVANFNNQQVGINQSDGLDMVVISDIHEWARHIGRSPVEIDRILYLIGVRQTEVNGQTVNQPWYPFFVRAVDAAVARGVPRKS